MNEKQSALAPKKLFRGKSLPDLLLDNALYIIMLIAIVYIAIRNPIFISIPSIVNIISLAAASLPAALGIG